MAYTFRLGISSDAAAIAKLGASVFETTFGYSIPQDDLEWYLKRTCTPEAITAEIESPERRSFVAVNLEGRVCGFTILSQHTMKPCIEPVDGTVELRRMYVDTATHGQSIGWGLLRCAETFAVEQGYQSIWLSSFSENKSTRRAYERWGFRYVGDELFNIGNTVHRDIIMLKDLKA